MDHRKTNRQYGYLSPENNGVVVRTLDYQQVAGYGVGIIYIGSLNYPYLPGNVVNAYTYDFPVRLQPVPTDIPRLFAADPTIADDIIAVCRHMIDFEGVRAICAACGFFGNFHQQVAEALEVPVALSSLTQVPFIRNLIKPSQKIGVLTADKSSLTPKLLDNCFITDHDQLVVKDLRHAPEFSCILEYRGEFDNGEVRNEVVSAALELLEEDADIGAIVLECSDMPPYAYAVQQATQLPVFDFITLIKWLHSGVHYGPYSGWI
ncbi:MAG: aspartate/glutamate racemase family protein [Clostridiales Family XIII bacterium]|jgi:Asp/Glu/hydantoin racemase|nr:aspartate/glutamate racemase family protein [Clostridiales Family XIII bacterium]